ALTLDGSGNVFVGGYFSTIGGQSRNFIAKVSGSGSGAVDGWKSNADYSVQSLALGAGGTLHVGGSFGMIAGQARAGYAVLAPTVPGAPVIGTAVAGNAGATVSFALRDSGG